MLDNKFLDKVCDQIISETRINNDKLYTPYSLSPYYFTSLPHPLSSSTLVLLFSFHCKEVYSLKNDQEIKYVWDKYKEEITTLMYDKELIH